MILLKSAADCDFDFSLVLAIVVVVDVVVGVGVGLLDSLRGCCSCSAVDVARREIR